MTIPKLTPYTGQVANPDGSQTQTEFTQNMFDQLSYEAQLATQLDATIDGMNNAVDEVEANAVSAQNSANAAEVAASSAGYQGLWPDTGGSANKGETWQTQVGGAPTGEYYTALQNTSVDPVGDNVNWKRNGDINRDNLSDYTGIVYKASGGNSAVENMVAGNPSIASEGDTCSTGGGVWRCKTDNPNSLGDFESLGPIYSCDFISATSADYTQKIQDAADAARDNLQFLYINSGIFGISVFPITANITIHPSVKGVIGKGGNIRVDSTLGNGGFYFAGPESGFPQPDGIIVDGLSIDANFNKCVPIWMSHPKNCKVTNNDIRNKTESHGILLRAEDPSGGTVSGNVISGNTVQGDQTAGVNSNYNGIIIDGLVDFGGLSPTDYWKANFTIPAPTVAVRDNVIEGNRVIGGYYGIALYGGIGNTISNNTVNSNIRSISLQNSCSQNVVTGNTLLAPDSSAVHVAWGSTTNLVTGNNIISTRGQNGQALLNNYIGSQANTFLGNNIFVTSAAEPQYMMYCGVKSDGTLFKDNTCSGSVTRAYAGVESSWNSNITNVGHAANGIPSIGEGWSNDDQRNVIFDGNIFVNTRADRSVFFISQIVDGSGSYPNTGTLLTNNVIKNPVTSKFYIELFEEAPGELNTVTLTGLTTPITPSADTAFALPRGRGHFSQVYDCTLLNNGTTTGAVGTEPTVAFSDDITLIPPSPQSVTFFSGGSDNQTIRVRLSSNTTIVHDNSKIRLKGSVNVTDVNSSNYISFTRQSGIWFENWRNF